ncbi:MAG: PEP-CTERM sorting domain-containing protein [Pseudomonadales bacterium]|nr:PEP-CTERM sorting domain-containing protein [Pseudomonadales bacterium]
MRLMNAILGTVALSASMSASALVIDFNDTALASDGAIAGCYQSSTYKHCSGNTVQQDGYNISGPAKYFIGPNYNNSDANNVAYDGDDFLLAHSGITFAQSGGGSFTLNGLDLGNWYDHHGASGTYDPQKTWRVTGNLLAGGSIFQDLTLDDVGNSADRDGNDFQSFILSGFADITSFSVTNISGGYPYMVLDNVVVNAEVPEPGTIAMFGLGLLGLGFARSKAKKA